MVDKGGNLKFVDPVNFISQQISLHIVVSIDLKKK